MCGNFKNTPWPTTFEQRPTLLQKQVYTNSVPQVLGTLSSSSTVSVTSFDYLNVSGNSVYTVRWHYPFENWAKSGNSYELTPLKYLSSDGPQAGNGFVHVKIPPNSVDYSIPSKIGGGVLAVGTALFAPELDPLVFAFLQGAGYTTALTSAPVENDLPLQGTAAQLAIDVGIQEDIQYTGTSHAFMPTAVRMTGILANQIYTSGDYAGYISGTYGPPGLMFDVTAYQHKRHQDYTGDAYNSHGYSGPASGYINWTGGYEYFYTWTLAN